MSTEHSPDTSPAGAGSGPGADNHNTIAAAKAAADKVAADAMAAAKATADAKAAADAQGAGDQDDVRTQLAELQRRLAQKENNERRLVVQQYLPDLIDEDTLQLAPAVELTAEGRLTAASKAKLDEWKAAKPHLFRSAEAQGDAGRRHTPSSTAGQHGAMSDEVRRALEEGGITVRDPSKVPGLNRILNAVAR